MKEWPAMFENQTQKHHIHLYSRLVMLFRTPKSVRQKSIVVKISISKEHLRLRSTHTDCIIYAVSLGLKGVMAYSTPGLLNAWSFAIFSGSA